MNPDRPTTRLTPEQICRLRRLSTPTVYNGWERITARDASREGLNAEETRDFAPDLGPIAGRAVTCAVRVGGPSSADHRRRWADFRRHVAEQGHAPTIIVIQDLDKPATFGSVWGEIASHTFRSLGCVGAIIDGGVRDIDECRAAGVKVLARRACVGHGVGTMVTFGEPVEVFGRRVTPGQLIHADRHGFLVVPPEDEALLLDAAEFLDATEAGLLQAARDSRGGSGEFLARFDTAIDTFIAQADKKFTSPGEW
jgi:regulator of RNase E activity RraA